jgi:thiamine-phosphate pyrophosphorylase
MSAPHSTPPLKGLYAITPDGLQGETLSAAVAAALAGGCRWIQYRDKRASVAVRRREAQRLNALCRAQNAGLIVNDDVALARDIGVAGAHLGEDDGDLALARATLGPCAILGASCYQDMEKARAALRAGADYVAFGALYPSPTKPLARLAPLALLRQAKRELDAPVCAIGGITLANAAPLLAIGVDLLAVVSDLFSSCDPAQITARAIAYRRLFEDIPYECQQPDSV